MNSIVILAYEWGSDWRERPPDLGVFYAKILSRRMASRVTPANPQR